MVVPSLFLVGVVMLSCKRFRFGIPEDGLLRCRSPLAGGIESQFKNASLARQYFLRHCFDRKAGTARRAAKIERHRLVRLVFQFKRTG